MVSYEQCIKLLPRAMTSPQETIHGEHGAKITYAIIDDVMCVTGVFVPAQHRRKGIAKKMLQSLDHENICLEACSDEGIPIAHLKKLYESCGFKNIRAQYLTRG